VVTHQLQVERRQGKFASQRLTFYRCATPPTFTTNSFAAADNISTDIAYSRGPSVVAEPLDDKINTLKRVNFTFIL